MLERFDASQIKLENKCWELFRHQHIKRYVFANQLISELFCYKPTVWDVSCGSGYGIDYLNNCYYVGFDNNKDILYDLSNKYKAKYYQVDLNSQDLLKQQRYSPDCIISFETVEHLKNPTAFLYQLYHVLHDDGILIFSAPTSKTKDFDPYHLHDNDKWTWYSLLMNAGFKIVWHNSDKFTCKFTDFIKVVPTSLSEKIAIARRCGKNGYILDRILNWILRNKFEWETTIYVARKHYGRTRNLVSSYFESIVDSDTKLSEFYNNS